MTIKEFFIENPDMLKRLKQCESEEEFTVQAEKCGLKIGTNKVSKVYNFVCNYKENQALKDEDLSEIAGGQRDFQVNSLDIGGKAINLIT